MESLTPTKLALVSRRARKDPKFTFTSLAHLLNAEFLRGCYESIGKDKACGIDGTSWREYGDNLDENLADLVERLKAKKYKPLPAKRVYIPKNDKESRPLGLPAIEDKIVQKGIARILEAIYEVDFMDCSYGFRPGRSCHQALKVVNDTIMFRPINHVIEADIKGFFDNVSHDWMMKFLQVRVRDSSLLLLIRRFLKAGYVESGTLVRTEDGTPQGGNLSPILANIFLHYVLDLWFVKRVRREISGQCYMVRYADDFICMVEHRRSAGELERMLRERFAQFDLTLHPEKTRTISFGRYERDNARRDNRRANTFEFLGFTHYCGKNRKGKFLLGRKTSARRFRRACARISQWLAEVRVIRIKDWWPSLAAKLRGHYNYYGVSGNCRMIANFGYRTVRAVYKWLNRRGDRKSCNWRQFNAYLARYPLPRRRIVHNFYQPSPLIETG
jgi:group II intron reverse transcriptase/maturase